MYFYKIIQNVKQCPLVRHMNSMCLIPLSTEGKDVVVNITPVDALHKKLK